MAENTRQIVLDTETTGLDPKEGHRLIELGCVELIDRRLTGNNYHQYLQPDREIDAEAIEVHGITNEFLVDKPRFNDVIDDFISYIDGTELIIHNAAFDVGFIRHELGMLSIPFDIEERCRILDTLALARKMYPGQRASLDALCKRLGIENGHRTLHGALLDAEILADVYLAMTGGQNDLTLEPPKATETVINPLLTKSRKKRGRLKVIKAQHTEITQHNSWLSKMHEKGVCLWPSENETTQHK